MKRWLLLSAVCLVLGLAVTPVFAQVNADLPQASPNDPDSAELVEHPNEWDGKTIDFAGEAITQVMVRGSYAWIHINDDAYYLKNIEEGAPLGGYNSGHAVWLPTELVGKIKHYGDYTHEGDVVTVRGTFNAACPQHGGDMDIHATSLDLIAEGRVVHEPVKLEKLGLAVLLLAVAGVLWLAHRRAQHLDMFGALSPKRR